MDPIKREVARVVSRAEALKQAICVSHATDNWTFDDLHNMADAGCMIWDKAEAICKMHPETKGELSLAISSIFEPLLLWSSEFSLLIKVIQSKTQHTNRLNVEDSAMLFLALCLQHKFFDDFSWQRDESFQKAQKLIPELIHDPSHTVAIKLCVGLFYLGMQPVARAMFEKYRNQPNFSLSLAGFAPLFWRERYLPEAFYIPTS
jgi:hypothetical protein